jgi:hypothetical protein
MDRVRNGVSIGASETRPAKAPLPPGVRAILWLDGVLLLAAALALAGMSPALGKGASAWTWIALGGSILTAGLAALSAFELSNPGASRAWLWLPVPVLLLWLGASGLGCLNLPQGTDVWGDKVAEAGKCLGFLLAVSAPLLALMLLMLWRSAPVVRGGALAMGALASAAAASSLLVLVHPHDTAVLDLAAHGIALAVVLAISAAAARFHPRT